MLTTSKWKSIVNSTIKFGHQVLNIKRDLYKFTNLMKTKTDKKTKILLRRQHMRLLEKIMYLDANINKVIDLVAIYSTNVVSQISRDYKESTLVSELNFYLKVIRGIKEELESSEVVAGLFSC